MTQHNNLQVININTTYVGSCVVTNSYIGRGRAVSENTHQPWSSVLEIIRKHSTRRLDRYIIVSCYYYYYFCSVLVQSGAQYRLKNTGSIKCDTNSTYVKELNLQPATPKIFPESVLSSFMSIDKITLGLNVDVTEGFWSFPTNWSLVTLDIANVTVIPLNWGQLFHPKFKTLLITQFWPDTFSDQVFGNKLGTFRISKSPPNTLHLPEITSTIDLGNNIDIDLPLTEGVIPASWGKLNIGVFIMKITKTPFTFDQFEAFNKTGVRNRFVFKFSDNTLAKSPLPKSLMKCPSLYTIQIDGDGFLAPDGQSLLDFTDPSLRNFWSLSITNTPSLVNGLTYPGIKTAPSKYHTALSINIKDTPVNISNFDIFTNYNSIHLPSCGLTGSFPPGIERTNDIVALFINNNSLTGSIPNSLCQRLAVVNRANFDISDNNFTGDIPSCFKCNSAPWANSFANNNFNPIDVVNNTCPNFGFNQQSFLVSTNGAVVDVNGTDFGWEISTSYPSTNPKLDFIVPNQAISITVPNGVGSSKAFTYSFHDGLKPYQFSIGYIPPSITFYSTASSSLILIGQNFGNQLQDIQIMLNDITALTVTSVTHDQVVITPNPIPPNTTFSLTAIMERQWYSPVLNVSIGQSDCEIDESTTGLSNTQIICHLESMTAPNDNGDALPIIIDVPIPDINGGSFIPGEKMSYTIGIEYLREIDTIPNHPQKLLAIKDAHWIGNSSLSIGTFTNDTVIITVATTIYNTPTMIYFAGDSFMTMSNSVKYTINISNWSFVTSLNTLQVIYLTKAHSTADQCTEITKEYTNDDSVYEIQSPDSVLVSRFSRRMIVDSRFKGSTITLLARTDSLYQLSNSSQDDVLTAIHVPYFQSSAILDPNFAILVKTDEDTDLCADSSSSKQKWKTPLIIACSIVGAMLIAVALALIIKKRLSGRRLRDVVMRNLNRRRSRHNY
eukprot:gene14496-17110_t